jgi:hypothetical protein
MMKYEGIIYVNYADQFVKNGFKKFFIEFTQGKILPCILIQVLVQLKILLQVFFAVHAVFALSAR